MSGIACAGNWIVDRLKIVDRYPAKGELANILSEEIGPGGSPFNILADFAKMKVPFPTVGFGCIGEDVSSKFLKALCQKYGIDTAHLTSGPDYATSYTDVFSIASSGERTFFHSRGANAMFDVHHVNIDHLRSHHFKLFHLGYLMLLDTLDSGDAAFGTRGARLLADVSRAGILTSLDLVTESPSRFANIQFALPHTDYLIINELEAERLTNESVRNHSGVLLTAGLHAAGEKLLKAGVRKAVIIHAPEIVSWTDVSRKHFEVPSLKIPKTMFKGTTGAGDACCAGILYGIHEGWSIADTLKFSTATAAACITELNTVDGLRPVKEILELSCALTPA